MEPTVSLWDARFHVAPDETVTAEASAITSDAPLSNVPALTVVEPVYAFAPLNSRIPLPYFVNEPFVAALAPDIVSVVPGNVTSIDEEVPVIGPPVRVKALSVDAVTPVY
jgi:hypothetical protein